MKACMWIIALSFIVLIPFATDALAQPKEATEAVTTTWYVTSKVLPLQEGRYGISYDATGLTVSDTGAGLFHGATVRSLGAFMVEKGIYNDERGWGVYNLQNGDKVFFAYTFAGELKPGGVGEAKGMITLTGGTGRCASIQGSFPMTRYTVRSAIELVGQSYTKAMIKYTLP